MVADSDAQRRFEVVFETTYGPVLAYVSRRVPADRTDDLVAHVFLTAWEQLESLPSEPLPWLYRTAWNAIGNDRRAAARASALGRRLRSETATNPPARDPGDQVASVERVRVALRGLRGKDREAIRLVCWEQLSVAEAASVLNCTPSALTVRLHRARRRLAAHLDEADAADSGAAVLTTLAKEQTR